MASSRTASRGALIGAALLLASAASAQTFIEQANARIAQHRQRDCRLVLTYANGEPLAGKSVTIRLTRHEFPFGSALCADELDNPTYTETFLSAFNFAVPRLAAKWRYTEAERGVLTYEGWDATVDFCRRNGVPLRGHTIFWEDTTKNPDWVQALSGQALRDALEDRIASVAPRHADTVLHWDVNNEMLSHSFYRSRLGDSIRVWMHQRARELAPDALLFTNEYNVLDGGNNLEPYIALVNSLRAAGAPIDGVGVQAHMTPSTNDGPTVYARLDRLATLGLPIWVTELDVTTSSESTRAAELEEFLRAAFSHPKVDGIILWGFWAGCHWRGAEASLWDADWRLNAAGERWLRLTQQEWSTTVTATVPADGAIPFRGFHGEYEAVVEWGDGTTRRVPFLLPKAPGEAAVRLAISDRPDDGGSGLLVR